MASRKQEKIENDEDLIKVLLENRDIKQNPKLKVF